MGLDFTIFISKLCLFTIMLKGQVKQWKQI